MKRKRFKMFDRLLMLAVVCGITFLTILQQPAYADDRLSVDTAKAVAVKFLTPKIQTFITQQAKPEQQIPAPITVSEVFTETRNGIPVYYIINLNPEGWVIVAANYVSRPIIAYSATETASAQNRPPEFDEWMENVAADIYNAISQGMKPLPEAQNEWSMLLTGASSPSPDGGKSTSASSVSPLLSTIWGQGGNSQLGADSCCWVVPWYVSEDLYCPAEISWSGYYRVAPTGCVATAVGQIMKRWGWPATGRGSHTWDPPFAACCTNSYGPYTVDFASRTYDWAIMPNDVVPKISGWETAGDRAVAQLLRDIGVALEMDYRPTGSGACLWQSSGSPGYCNAACNQTTFERQGAMKAFKDYFRYHTPTYTIRSCMSDSEWVNLLKSELNAARPILYEGSGSGEHAFVCDGYDASNNFHFNWGWDGSYNGYYALNDLTPGSRNYSIDQGILYNIQPDTTPVAQCKPAILYLNQNGQAVLQPSAIDGGSYDPDGNPVSLSVDRSQFNCTHTGTPQTVTLTATDNTGNTASCTTSVTVIDNTPPTVKTKNITLYLDASGKASIMAADINNGSTDNCGIASLSVSPSFFTCANIGPNAVTLTITDNQGNRGSCAAIVTVMDKMAPILQAVPADITVECNAVLKPASVTATDNCDKDMTVNFNEVRTDGACPNRYTLSRTWTAADDCGNTTIAKQVIAVQDTTPPVIKVSLAENAPYYTTQTVTVVYSVIDNCASQPVVKVELSNNGRTPMPIDAGQLVLSQLAGRNVITVTATDACNNVQTKSVYFEVILQLTGNDLTIKPETLMVNPGVFTAFVVFPMPYDALTITDAVADGAPHQKIDYQTSAHRVIIKFERKDITILPVDIHFEVSGHFIYKGASCRFVGSDDINKINEDEAPPKDTGGSSNNGQDKSKK